MAKVEDEIKEVGCRQFIGSHVVKRVSKIKKVTFSPQFEQKKKKKPNLL